MTRKHKFSCGHTHTFLGMSSFNRWRDRRICPQCWAARPTVRLLVTQIDHQTAGYPGVRLEATATSVRGFTTPPELVVEGLERANVVLEEAGLPGYPGLDLGSKRDVRKVRELVGRLEGMEMHVVVSGKYADEILT